MKKRRTSYYNDMPFMKRKSYFMLFVLRMMMGKSRMDGRTWMGVYFSPIFALRLGFSCWSARSDYSFLVGRLYMMCTRRGILKSMKSFSLGLGVFLLDFETCGTVPWSLLK